MKKIQTVSREETIEIAKEILRDLKGNVILLQGELGAGKTTFAQGVLKALDAEGPFTSPTFVILKQYKLGKSQITNSKKQINSNIQPTSPRLRGLKIPISNFQFVYHFDCYRVGPEDVLELGWEEIIANRKNLVLVEWPERIRKIWPKAYLLLKFENVSETERLITTI